MARKKNNGSAVYDQNPLQLPLEYIRGELARAKIPAADFWDYATHGTQRSMTHAEFLDYLARYQKARGRKIAGTEQLSLLGKKKAVPQEKGQLVALGFLPMGSHFRTKGFHYVITQPGRQFVDATRSGHVKSGGTGYTIDRRNGADMVEWIATTEPGPGIMGAVGSIQADVTKVRSAVDNLQKLVAETFKGIKSTERKAKEPAQARTEKKARRSQKREREEEDRRRREYEDSIPF